MDSRIDPENFKKVEALRKNCTPKQFEEYTNQQIARINSNLPPEFNTQKKSIPDTRADLCKKLSFFFYKIMGAAQTIRVLSSMSEANYNDQKERGHIIEWPKKSDILTIKSVEELHLTELNTYSIKEPLLSKMQLVEGLGGMKISSKGKSTPIIVSDNLDEKDLELHCSRKLD